MDLPVSERLSYYDYKLKVSRQYVYQLIIIAGFMNLLLLVPDLALIKDGAARIMIAIIRIVYSIVLFILSFRIKAISSFKLVSVIVSLCELAAGAIFLFVFSQYGQPNFMIQTMGIILLVLIVFLIPNRLSYMLVISLLVSAGFFICARVFISSIEFTDYVASATYVSFSILLCALAARSSENHQRNEFKAKRKLEHVSSTDYLTDTANRLKISEEAERWIAFCVRHELPLSLIFFDVDDLKTVNDRYGHSAGDFVLANLAKLIQGQLRTSDILARWGGDEFVILLPNVTLENAVLLAKRVELNVRENILIEGTRITCSFGVTTMKKDSTFESLVGEADCLMYNAKQQGKDVVQYSK